MLLQSIRNKVQLRPHAHYNVPAITKSIQYTEPPKGLALQLSLEHLHSYILHIALLNLQSVTYHTKQKGSLVPLLSKPPLTS